MNWEGLLLTIALTYIILWLMGAVSEAYVNRHDKREREKADYDARIDAVSLKPKRDSGMEKKR